jgi:hypothetical protein
LDLIQAVLREYGPVVGGWLIVIGTLALAVRLLFARLERAHEREIAAIERGHTATLAAMKVDCDRGWTQSAVWQQQAERLAERYTEATQLAADMSDEVLQRRRRAR